jgi:hypothetical protein
MMIRLVSLGVLVLGVSLATASDLPVTYAVQEKPLKTSGIAGTPLTFTLYSDNACTQQVYQAVVPIENVELISRLKLLTPKGAVKGPTTDELHTMLTGVELPAQTYLKVTGMGVTASGGDCQLQVSSKTSAPGAVWKDANGLTIGPLSNDMNIRSAGSASGANPVSAALSGVPGTVVQAPIAGDGSGFADPLCILFSSTGCTGQAFINEGRLFGGDAFAPPALGGVVGTTLYYASGEPTAVSVQSADCDHVCFPDSFPAMAYPTTAASVSAFTAPFHLEMQ